MIKAGLRIFVFAGLVVLSAAAMCPAQEAAPDEPTTAESTTEPAQPADETTTPTTGPAAQPTEPTASPKPQPCKPQPEPAVTEEAQKYYKELAKVFMSADWDEFDEQIKLAPKYNRGLTREQRAAVAYMPQTAPQYRPRWWKSTKSSTAVSFTAEIWSRSFTANYWPSEHLGFEVPVDIKDGKLMIVVGWRPSLVDSMRRDEGPLGKRFGLRWKNLGEAIVWHELGHNYITSFLPVRDVMTLYEKYRLLFSTLQEFYADLTSLYHSSPYARLTCLFMRLSELDKFDESDPHTRASYAIGSLILSNVLMNPEKWPSIHLPPKVPDSEIERNTIILQ